MASINVGILTGCVGKSPNIRKVKVQGGETMAMDFNMAVVRGWGEKQETYWIRVQLFGAIAEYASKWVQKGSSILVEGYLATATYTTADGQNKTITYIQAEQIKQLWKSDNKESFNKKMEDYDDLPC
mgnify:CR=1 FL=1